MCPEAPCGQSGTASSARSLACLGPEGSFSHLLAGKLKAGEGERIGPIVPLPSIGEVFDYLATQPDALGLVPIENSSGGFIIDTVDRLLDERCQLQIQEELTLEVRLALMGKASTQQVLQIHSHAMPFFHCDEWLQQHYPKVQRVTASSTAAAAMAVQASTMTQGLSAIGPGPTAAAYGLQILCEHIAPEVLNLTQFYLIGHGAGACSNPAQRTALAVDLPDRPGSLCRFLTPLSQAGINLKRLESRPLRGKPNQYRFFLELEGEPAQDCFLEALEQTRRDGAQLRVLGSFAAHRRFLS